MKSEDASGAFFAAIPSPTPPKMTHSANASVMIFSVVCLLLFRLILSALLLARFCVFPIVVFVSFR